MLTRWHPAEDQIDTACKYALVGLYIAVQLAKITAANIHRLLDR